MDLSHIGVVHESASSSIMFWTHNKMKCEGVLGVHLRFDETLSESKSILGGCVCVILGPAAKG